MPEVISSRFPIPHLFMVLTIGVFVLMTVSAFAPAQAEDRVATAAGPGAELLPAGTAMDPAAPAVDTLTLASLVLLVALVAVTIGAGRAGAHGSGRPILGLVAGLLAGVAAAASLFSLGVITRGSPTWVYAPLALATLGNTLGLTAPFQRRWSPPPRLARNRC